MSLTLQEQRLVEAYRAVDIARRMLDRADAQLSRAQDARRRAAVDHETALAALQRLLGS
jgi:hypothetical protein